MTSEKLLQRFVGIAFFREDRPGFIKSHESFLFALARTAFVRHTIPLRESKGRLGPTALRTGGQAIIDGLGVFLANASKAWLPEKQRSQALLIKPNNTQSPPSRTIRLKSGSLLTQN